MPIDWGPCCRKVHRLLGDGGRRKELNRRKGDGGLELHRQAQSCLVFHFLSAVQISQARSRVWHGFKPQNQLGCHGPACHRILQAYHWHCDWLQKVSRQISSANLLGLLHLHFPKLLPTAKGKHHSTCHSLQAGMEAAHPEEALLSCYFESHGVAFVQLGQNGSIQIPSSDLLELGLLDNAVGLALEVGDMLPGHLQKGQLL